MANTEIRIPIEYNGKRKKFAFLSLLKDNSISVGFTERFLASQFTTTSDPDHIFFASENLETNRKISSGTIFKEEAITNPHVTFHPPNKVHIRNNHQEIIYGGIYVTDIDLEVENQGSFQWIQVVSNPVDSLDSFNNKPSRKIKIIPIFAPSENCSVRLFIDFVKSTFVPKQTVNSYIEKCGGKTLHIYGEYEPATKANLMFSFHLGGLGNWPMRLNPQKNKQ